ncbi:MAG: PAS domain-containing protein [Anaerolineae bacterium]|nr:PAS domain-containing protein [Anaerolineae bacterium]
MLARMTLLSQWMEVPTSTDPEDARRRKLLNLLLLLVLVVDAFMIALTAAVIVIDGPAVELELMLVSMSGVLLGILALYAINRYRSGALASTLFLLMLTIAFTFSDVPKEVADGRSLFLFALPIIMASVLLQPYTSFVFAGLSGVIVAGLAIVEVNIIPNFPAIAGFFFVALVSWLSARSLERALIDLRAINRELDQRVEDRTQELAEALIRVQAESSKNQAILESIADGVIVFDNMGRAIVANHAISPLLNRSISQITGKHVEELLGPNRENPEHRLMIDFVKDRTARGTSRVKFEFGEKTLSVSAAAVRDTSGEATGTVVVFRDYTREAEVDRMKSAFVSMVSHELRTPLNAILGYGDMLKEEVYGPLAEGQRTTVQRVVANGQRMLGLVNNLLDQAQIEAGRITVNMMTFEPTALVEDLQSVMEVLAEQKHLKLICEVADDVPQRLISDRHRLHQILVNLVGNAIKFTQEGQIAIRVFTQDSDHWVLEISDTGPGIPQEAQAYIFEPFRQVDGTATRHHEGSGLGLSIVKQLANLLGGEITLKSDRGQGSTFTVTLPIVLEQEEATV